MPSRFEYQTNTDRGICPVCGRSIQIRKNGRIRQHGANTPGVYPPMNCAGGGQKPKES